MKTLYYNGHIYTGNHVFVDHFVESSGIIIDTHNEPLSTLMKNCDRKVDLKGHTVIPGFNDCHLHLASVGEWMDALNLMGCCSIEEVIQKGKQFIANDSHTFLQGRGWNEDLFVYGNRRSLTRNDLDQISTEIPIIFTRVCGHVATCNSKAIELLGLTSETTIKEGELLKDEDGNLNGLFTENAIKLLQPLYPEKNKTLLKRYLKKAMHHANSFGITSVQSNDIMDPQHIPFFDCLKEIQNDNQLTLRYTFQFNFQEVEDFEKYLKTEFLKKDYDETWLSKGALKLYKDGSLGGRTALMREPYHDAPSTKGVDALLEERFDALCRLAHSHNIQIVTHAIGDAAIESCIEKYAELNKSHENPLRHGIVHCQITDNDMLNRIKDQNLTVLFQPIFIDYDHQIVQSRVGETLASTSYAIGTLQDKGVHIAFSTDAPVESVNPFENLYCAVTRKGIKTQQTYNANEAITIEKAIDAYTYESAYIEHKEHFKGLLSPGYCADFIILDHNIFKGSPEVLLETNVLETYVNGTCVYKIKD